MTLEFFHTPLMKARKLIDKENVSDQDIEHAKEITSHHRGKYHIVEESAEFAFKHLVLASNQYIQCLLATWDNLNSYKKTRKEMWRESALTNLRDAIDHGKKIVKWAEKVNGYTKKEELESI